MADIEEAELREIAESSGFEYNDDFVEGFMDGYNKAKAYLRKIRKKKIITFSIIASILIVITTSLIIIL